MNTKFKIISTGNDPQVSFAIGMFNTARQKFRGAFNGDCYFVSTSLSERSISKLEKLDINVVIINQQETADLQNTLASDVHPFGKLAKFHSYLYALSEIPPDDSYIVLMDPDILWQKPVSDLLIHQPRDRVFFATEPVSVETNATLFAKLKRPVLRGLCSESVLSDYTKEINTGFFFGPYQLVELLLKDFCSWQTQEQNLQFAHSDEKGEHAWHDQDYFRYYRLHQRPQNLAYLSHETVFHLIGWATIPIIWNFFPTKVKHKHTEAYPVVVHFAHSWQKYYWLANIFGRHISLGENARWLHASCSAPLKGPVKRLIVGLKTRIRKLLGF